MEIGRIANVLLVFPSVHRLSRSSCTSEERVAARILYANKVSVAGCLVVRNAAAFIYLADMVIIRTAISGGAT